MRLVDTEMSRMCRFMGDLCSDNRAVGETETKKRRRRGGEEKERIRKLLLPLVACFLLATSNLQEVQIIIQQLLIVGEYNYRTAIVVHSRHDELDENCLYYFMWSISIIWWYSIRK